jgi:hypothetical protein
MIRDWLAVTPWLIRDTFRQAAASGLLWFMFGANVVVILVCLSAGVREREPVRSGVDTDLPSPERDRKGEHVEVEKVPGELTLAFGSIRVPFDRDARTAVRYLQLLLAGGVADTAGILLALIFTAGFLPRFLDPRSSIVLLTKPSPRWVLLIGKFVGVLTFVAVQAVIFVVGTWFALGLSTGYWESMYLACIPLLLVHFAAFYSVSVLLATSTRSTLACIFGVICFWLLCWGMNYGRHFLVITPEAERFSGLLRWTVEAGYWILPKPADMGLILFETLDAGPFFMQPLDLQALRAKNAYQPMISVLASLVFGAAMLGVACRDFNKADQ